MKKAGSILVVVASAVVLLAALLLLWRSSLSIQVFSNLATVETVTQADVEFSSRHLSATINLTRIVSGVILVGTILALVGHFVGIKRNQES